ncbi:MAG: LAGLIDADG family homing endonuclease [bacterium]|nr:LAGLIDADG family homing endonuclease [bacterium]
MTWEYIAGFFDGEGSLTQNGRGCRITIPQTNLKVLQAIKQFTRCGRVIRVTKRRPHWKESWVFSISRQSDVLRFLQHVTPFLIVKHALSVTQRPRIATMVERLEQEETARVRQRRTVRSLRRRGWSYRAIGKRVGLDWGWIRRIALHAAPK